MLTTGLAAASVGLSSPLPSHHRWDQAKSRAKTKGLLSDPAAMRTYFICADIFAVTRNDKVLIIHLLSLGLREMEILKNLAGASHQDEPRGLMILWQLLMNRQGKGLSRGNLKDTKTPCISIHRWCPQGALLRESMLHVMRDSKYRIHFGSAGTEGAKSPILTEPCGSEHQWLNSQHYKNLQKTVTVTI